MNVKLYTFCTDNSSKAKCKRQINKHTWLVFLKSNKHLQLNSMQVTRYCIDKSSYHFGIFNICIMEADSIVPN